MTSRITAALRAWHLCHPQAAYELTAILQGGGLMPERATGTSESAVEAVLLLEAGRAGVRLFRNNVGVLPNPTGRPVRYGLANTSAALNEVVKSSDYVGWRKRVIQPRDVGAVIAQTVLRECKHVGWTFTPTDPHELAQLAWLQLGAADGCDAAFCTGEGTL